MEREEEGQVKTVLTVVAVVLFLLISSYSMRRGEVKLPEIKEGKVVKKEVIPPLKLEETVYRKARWNIVVCTLPARQGRTLCRYVAVTEGRYQFLKLGGWYEKEPEDVQGPEAKEFMPQPDF